MLAVCPVTLLARLLWVLWQHGILPITVLFFFIVYVYHYTDGKAMCWEECFSNPREMVNAQIQEIH